MITLEKGTDAREINPGRGGNDGPVQLTTIGGVPLRKIPKAVIRLAGDVHCVTIAPGWFETSIVTLYDRDGEVQRHRVPEGWEATRRAVLRRAITDGVFAGVVRLS